MQKLAASPFPFFHSRLWAGLGLPIFVVGLLWLWASATPGEAAPPQRPPQQTEQLSSGVVASLDSPAFTFSDGWQRSPAGADPPQPADAWNEPAGRLTFRYTGRELALQLAVGDYWGYLFVTVDGAPANRLPHIPGNLDSAGQAAGYKPLLAPEQQTADGPAPVWVPVHRAADDGPHEVSVEVWRSWGQIPLRGVAVDALPPPRLPRWPGIGLGLAGIVLLAVGLRNGAPVLRALRVTWNSSGLTKLYEGASAFIGVYPRPQLLVIGAMLATGAGVFRESWLLTDAGLVLLALVAFFRPEAWAAALLFGLPFYLHPLPLLPGRGLNLIEVGVWGGVAIVATRWVIFQREGGEEGKRQKGKAKGAALGSFFQRKDAMMQRGQGKGEEGKRQKGKAKGAALGSFFQRGGAEEQRDGEGGARLFTQYPIPTTHYALPLLICLALLSALAADYSALALREWRTVFVAAGGFALLLGGIFAQTDDAGRARRWLVNGWLAGGTAVALIALWQFVSGEMIVQAEGVARVRGLYGSPNNLALYLERTLAVGIAYCVLRTAYWDGRRDHLIRNTQYAILLLPLLAALVLTFSKGALFLGIPALLLVLGGGGVWLLARQGRSLRFLWWLAGIGGVVVLGLLPFLGTERFRLLLDFGAGTTGGLRLNLWRSAWAMALDHLWLGVGPDNFLYAYRSGYLLPTAWQDPNLNHPHNFVLDWWTRLGLPGLLLAVVWIGGGVQRLWRTLRTGSEPGLALGALAAIAASLAHGLIDASFALPDLMLVWVLLLSVDKGVSKE